MLEEMLDLSGENLTFINQSHSLQVDFDTNVTLHNYTQAFKTFSRYYQPVHGYLSLLVCIFGIFANLLNIVVLTRKEMASSTNTILTGLAVADLMVMVEYIPFTIHTSIEMYESPLEQYSYPWAIFTLFHAHFSVIFHSISTWLTVILAIWRYTSVSFPTESKRWCSMSNAKLTIGLTYIIVPIVCIPCYFSFEIVTHEDSTYAIDYSDVSKENNELLKKINFWVYSIGLKILPCILLTHLSLALIRVLMEAERRKQRLKNNLTSGGSSTGTGRDRLQSQSNDMRYTGGSFKSQRCIVLSSTSPIDVNTSKTLQSTSKKPEVILNIHEAEKNILTLERQGRFCGDRSVNTRPGHRQDEDIDDDDEEEDEEEAEVNSSRPETNEKKTSNHLSYNSNSRSKVASGLSFLSSLGKKTTSAVTVVPSTSSSSSSASCLLGKVAVRGGGGGGESRSNDKSANTLKAPCDLVSPAITYTSDVDGESNMKERIVESAVVTDSSEETQQQQQHEQKQSKVKMIRNESSDGQELSRLLVPSNTTTNHGSVGVNQVSTSSSSRRESDGVTLMTGLTCVSLAASSNTTSTRISRLSHANRTSTSQSDRTTRMLLAILLLFLLTEFPSGVVTLLSGVMGEAFLVNVYHPLGEVFDILALVNSAINFILYCVMSRLFRKTFCKIFWPQKYRTHYASADRAVRKGVAGDLNVQHTAISTLPPGHLETIATAGGNNNCALIASKHSSSQTAAAATAATTASEPVQSSLLAPLVSSPSLSTATAACSPSVDHASPHRGPSTRRQHHFTHPNNLLQDIHPIELTETEARRSSFIPLTAAAVPMDLSTPPSNQSTML